MITPFGFTLKERAPMLHKFLGTRVGRKLGVKFCILLFKRGYFTLQLFYLFFESLRLFTYQSDTLFEDSDRWNIGKKIKECTHD